MFKLLKTAGNIELNTLRGFGDEVKQLKDVPVGREAQSNLDGLL
jgi:hypothetical protein